MSLILNPSEEGITHINVYSRSNLEIGRMLSNFYKYEFDSPYGKFNSVEAYWHYLSIPECSEREELKNLYGYEAKKIGQNLIKSKGRIELDNFEDLITDIIKKKFIYNKDMLLKDSKYLSLPFTHYYVDSSSGKIIDVRNKYKWMIDNITYIRSFIIDEYL